MGKRGKYEFSERTKHEAKKRWHKLHPNRENEKLEVDHRIAVWFCRKYNIPSHLARTQRNAQALTKKEHREKHRNEPTEEEYMILAQAILGWSKNLL